MIEMGKKIKIFRIKHDITTKEMAEIIGVTTATVNNWEAGKTKANINAIVKLCKIKQVQIDDFLTLGETDDGKRKA